MKSVTLSGLLSAAGMAMAQAATPSQPIETTSVPTSTAAGAVTPTVTTSMPSATLGSNNIHTLMNLGYNSGQASFYAHAITQANVASAYEALNAEGAIERINQATVQSEYDAILNAAVASLPPELREPAKSFFHGIEALATTTAAKESGSSGKGEPVTLPGAPASTGSPSLILASGAPTVTGPSGMVTATQGQSSAVGSSAGVSGSATPANAVSSALAPRDAGVAMGALVAGIAGFAFAL